MALRKSGGVRAQRKRKNFVNVSLLFSGKSDWLYNKILYFCTYKMGHSFCFFHLPERH